MLPCPLYTDIKLPLSMTSPFNECFHYLCQFCALKCIVDCE